MKQTAFITGANGFVGRHLRAYLQLRGLSVYGVDARPMDMPGCFHVNLTDGEALWRILQEIQPQFIFHLAGVLKSSESHPFYQTHVYATAVLLDSVLAANLRPRVLIASSSAVYGAGLGARPMSEGFTPRPLTHYAVSKLAQEEVALRYYHAFGLHVAIARTFNLLGAGLSPQMAPSAFAMQIAQAEMKQKPKVIHTGDLSARRDYVDVRDAARAYDLILRHGGAGEVYNVASGRAVSLTECLQILMRSAKVNVQQVYDPQRGQNHDVPVQVGSAQKIQRQTGWSPRIGLSTSLKDMLQDWRLKLREETL